MENDEIKKLIEVRTQLLGAYSSLDGKNEPMAVVKQKSVAEEFEMAIKKIDIILKQYVNFS
tara:strand:+ start:29319 stop:29501 length:183 start_codon:yes stop_codon:yes gene_type:complete